MENIKYLNINDLENNYYCLINEYILIYKDNIWKNLNIEDEENYKEIFLNFFDYHPIFKSLQYFKKYTYPFQIITKYDNPIIYINNKYYNRINLLNIFLNSLTYYIINYEQEKINDYHNILKNNIICSVLREYNKNLDYSLKYKTKDKKETLDRIYFKNSFFNDLSNLNLGIKFGFKNINCFPFIKKINIFSFNLSFILDDDENIIFSKLNDKKIKNNLFKYKIDNIIIKCNKNNKYSFIKTNEKFKGNIFFDNIIIDFPNQNLKNIKIPTSNNILPKNPLSSISPSSPSYPSKHSSDLSSIDTSTLSSSKDDDNKIKLNDVHNKLKIIKPIDKNNKLLIKTIGDTLSFDDVNDDNDDNDDDLNDDEELTTASSSSILTDDIDLNKSSKIKNIKIEDEQFIPFNLTNNKDINDDDDKDINDDDKDINKEYIKEEEIIYEDKEEDRKKIIKEIKDKIKDLNKLIDNLEI